MPHNNQVTAFSAPLDDALGPFVPFNTPSNRSQNELILGLKLFGDRGLFTFDPHRWKREGRIKATTGAVFGDIDAGKSALNKIISAEYGAVFNAKRKQRIYADDHRRLNGVSEYSRLAQYYDSRLVTLDEKINVFDKDLGLTMSDHLETTQAIFSSASDGQLPARYMTLAMQAALHLMYERDDAKNVPSAEYLVRILLEIKGSDVNEYLKSVTQQIAIDSIDPTPSTENALEAELVAEDGVDPLVKPVANPTNINWEEFQHDAGIVASHVIRFLTGDFGDTFGGTASIAKKFGSRFCGFDYSGKNDQTVAFLVGFIWRIKTSAQQRDDHRFMFDIENHDENVGLWNFSSYARPMAKALKQARGYQRLTLMTTHRPLDYETVGSAESQVRKLATNMLKDVGFYVIGKYENATDAYAARDYFGLTRYETEQIMRLRPGEYGIKFPGEPLHFFGVPLTPVRRWLIETNAANFEALVRR